jgi:metallo-beta-lactamase class B
MNRPRAAAFSFVAVLAAAAGCAQKPPPPSEATVAAHVAEARRLAGDDLKPLLGLCNPAPAIRPDQASIDKLLAAVVAQPAPDPGRVFDNLYYVGAAWVSAWAIRTSQGIILIDALNNGDEARRVIDDGLRKVGLDPADLRWVVVTHAHGDHYGGLEHLAPRYRPGVVMSEADWRQAEGRLEFDSPLWGRPPKFDAARDRKAIDGGRLVLGDTAVTFYVTPGHTEGTLSLVFDVGVGGRPHRALLWGGTAFNFGKDVPRLESYIAATRRMAEVAGKDKVDVMLSNHPSFDDSLAKMDDMRRGTGGRHPFVIGNDAVLRGLGVMNACAQAQRGRFSMR